MAGPIRPRPRRSRSRARASLSAPFARSRDVSVEFRAGIGDRVARRERRRQVDPDQAVQRRTAADAPDGFCSSGRETALPNPFAAAELGIAVVHQEPQLVSAMTIAENIFLARLGAQGAVAGHRPGGAHARGARPSRRDRAGGRLSGPRRALRDDLRRRAPAGRDRARARRPPKGAVSRRAEFESHRRRPTGCSGSCRSAQEGRARSCLSAIGSARSTRSPTEWSSCATARRSAKGASRPCRSATPSS